MKYFYTLLFLISFYGFGQCPQGFISFTSQAQLDQFIIDYPNCQELSTLSLSGLNITNLAGLSNLITINGGLTVSNTGLENLDGLDNLTYIGSGDFQDILTIQDNSLLTNIAALSSASSSRGMDIGIFNNPKLTSLEGFKNINSEVLTFEIRNNSSLENISALNNIEIVESLSIIDNPSLISLDGLQSLTLLGGGFVFNNNDLVQNFSTLEAVELNCGIEIRDNLRLENIEGFVRGEIDCGNSVYILNNPELSFCSEAYICKLIEIASSDSLDVVEIVNNGSNCSNVDNVLSNCETPPANDDCENAFLININETVQSNNQSGNQSSYLPSCNFEEEIIDVWFTFNSQDLTTIDITVDSGFNLQLWEGDCTSLTQVNNACSADNLNNIQVRAETDYYIQVWSEINETERRETGQFSLTVQDGTLSNINLAFETLKLYPNPVNSNLSFESAIKVDGIRIINSIGQNIMAFNPNLSKGEIDLNQLNSGLYFLEVEIDSIRSIFKILKN